MFGSQATVYAIRERRHLWGTRPSLLLGASSVVDIAIASTLAVGGIAMTPLPALLVAGTLVAAALFAFVLDFVKVLVFARLGTPKAGMTSPRLPKLRALQRRKQPPSRDPMPASPRSPTPEPEAKGALG